MVVWYPTRSRAPSLPACVVGVICITVSVRQMEHGHPHVIRERTMSNVNAKHFDKASS
jgi:hypothetical protein